MNTAIHAISCVVFGGCFFLALVTNDRFERTFAIATIGFGVLALLTK
jgi:hypothetical protein